jgi:PII-like signaling protein
MNPTGHSVLKIYASSTDKVGMKLLYEYIVYLAKEKGISGVTVYRGIMGYGQSSKHISSSKFWELTEKLPIMIEIVDQTEVLENFYELIEPELLNMSKGCLVSMEDIEMKLLKSGNK